MEEQNSQQQSGTNYIGTSSYVGSLDEEKMLEQARNARRRECCISFLLFSVFIGALLVGSFYFFIWLITIHAQR